MHRSAFLILAVLAFTSSVSSSEAMAQSQPDCSVRVLTTGAGVVFFDYSGADAHQICQQVVPKTSNAAPSDPAHGGVPGTAVCQLASTRGDANATVWVGSTSVTLGGSRGQQAELNGFYYAANVCMGTATDAAGGSLP